MVNKRIFKSKGGEGDFSVLPILERTKVIIFGEDAGGEHKPNIVNQLLVAIIMIAIIMIIVGVIKMIITMISGRLYDSPWIIKDTHDASQAMQIVQDPNDSTTTLLRRSNNEHKGLEFTYLFWVYVEDFTTTSGNNSGWKHILHKGSKTSYPNRAPGIWFHPNLNIMRVYMNTYTNITSNYIDIHNIPISKWYQFALIVREKSMDVYINGYLKKRVVLKGIPKQNFGDLYVTMNGGFNGFLSRMRYFDYAVQYSQIESHLRKGPSSKMPESTRQKPPYLTPYWWFNNPNLD